MNYGAGFAGVDEVGRGCLAGDVVAAAVVLPVHTRLTGLRDSKQLSPDRRAELDQAIREQAVAFGIGRAGVGEIEDLNILGATMLAMSRALADLPVRVAYALIDGHRLPELEIPADYLVRGDSRHLSISAASIVAKVTRDLEMVEAADRYPGYGFERHKGYGTREHLEAIRRLGPCPLHRMSFAPLRDIAKG